MSNNAIDDKTLDRMESEAMRTLAARKAPVSAWGQQIQVPVTTLPLPQGDGPVIIHVVEPQDVLNLVTAYRDLQEKHKRLNEACDVFEKNSEDACELESLLRRIRAWDHMDTALDGGYWKSEIDKLVPH